MNRTVRHIPFLDDLRGFSILAVFVFHALGAAFDKDRLPWVGWFRGWDVEKTFYAVFPAQWGWIGVTSFFVISGFCIHLNHRHWQHRGWKAFWLRRFLRIYPPYLVALGIFGLGLLIRTGVFGLHAGHWLLFTDAWHQVLVHLFLVHNFDDAYFYRINPAFWSIAVEVQLYLLYPVLLWIAAHLGWARALAVTGLVEIVLRGAEAFMTVGLPEGVFPCFVSGSPFYFWFSWSIGAALAEAWIKEEPLPFRNFLGFVWPVLFVVAWFFRPLYAYSFTVAALATASLIAWLLGRPGAVSSAEEPRNAALRHLRSTGIVSYSMYLIHQPCVNMVPIVLVFCLPHHRLPHVLIFAIALTAWFPIYGLSCLFHKYVELPSMAWGKRIIARQKAEPAPELA